MGLGLLHNMYSPRRSQLESFLNCLGPQKEEAIRYVTAELRAVQVPEHLDLTGCVLHVGNTRRVRRGSDPENSYWRCSPLTAPSSIVPHYSSPRSSWRLNSDSEELSFPRKDLSSRESSFPEATRDRERLRLSTWGQSLMAASPL